MHTVTVSPDEVRKIGKLANLNLQENEVDLFAGQFTKTIEVVNELNEIDTSSIPATYQVNGLTNVTRADEVDMSRVLPQEVALREAKHTQNGFFVVKRVIDSDAEELL
ncbi:MAG TPA: Asp-tRNA(Asn)/Glu-tRNA(Gln) amidotransferase subunit GatC [Candidatus Woesebacteria bacterium]|nr:Asp-tRNA(Asn)/Glu-tRNA(Gln) amidotransferase subunit GatC [Candidatus Woesebacteria bacterium]